MLYRSEAFERLTDEPWDEGRVRAAIQRIVDDADDSYDPDGLWPAHEWDVWQTPLPLKSLYVGAGGVVWALDALRRCFAEGRPYQVWLHRDPDFEPLRKSAAFLRLLRGKD